MNAPFEPPVPKGDALEQRRLARACVCRVGKSIVFSLLPRPLVMVDRSYPVRGPEARSQHKK